MKKQLILAITLSMLAGSIPVQGAEHAEDTVTRTASIKLHGVNVEFEETQHTCEQGYSIWYSRDLLKVSEFGGHECFIPSEEEDALHSAVKFIMVVEDDENTLLSLEEPLAAYTNTGETYETLEISEITAETLESGLLLETAQVICNDTADYFYLAKDEAEENVLYITASMPIDEQETYSVWFDQMVETIDFGTDMHSFADSSNDVSYGQLCSLCEEYKECGSYTVNGITYLVCDNDYNEFAHAFDLETYTPVCSVCDLCGQIKECGEYFANDMLYYVCDDDYNEFVNSYGLASESTYPVCSLCEQAKDCGEYFVNGQTYYVCDDDYNEFAYAFGLASTSTGQVCSLCEQVKDCGEYTVDGQTYYVCDDDYNEFAYAFGLN